MSEERPEIDHNNIINAPRISFEVMEYVCDFFVKELLEPKKLTKSKWNFYLSLLLISSTKKDPIIEHIAPTESRKIVSEDIVVKFMNYPRKDTKLFDENYTIYMKAPFSKDTTPKEFVNYLFFMFAHFFNVRYKKINEEDVLSLQDKLDWNYINSIEFPAPFEKLNYTGFNNFKDIYLSYFNDK